MKPKHLALAILGAFLLLFVAQNVDLFYRESAVKMRFLAWRTEVRPIALLFLLPVAGFAVGYLTRLSTEHARRRRLLEGATRPRPAASEDETPHFRKTEAEDEPEGAE